MEKKIILGISSSPRKGANTDILLERALTAASEYEYIETKNIFLRDYRIEPCNSCFACCTEAAAKGAADKACLSIDDDMHKLYPLLKECDALILASPVYFGGMNGQMKVFLDRTEGLLRYGKSIYQNALRYKIGGGLTVGGNRNAGQETTLQALHYYFFVQDMTVVGSGSEPTPGCYLGGGATTYPNHGRKRDAVVDDEIGLKSTEMLGRRVALALGMMK